MLKGLGFMMVLVGSTVLDGSLWFAGLVACAIGAVLMLTEVKRWTA